METPGYASRQAGVFVNLDKNVGKEEPGTLYRSNSQWRMSIPAMDRTQQHKQHSNLAMKGIESVIESIYDQLRSFGFENHDVSL